MAINHFDLGRLVLPRAILDRLDIERGKNEGNVQEEIDKRKVTSRTCA